MMFVGFKSRWAILYYWIYLNPWVIITTK